MKYSAFLLKAKLGEHGVIINAPEDIESEFLEIGYLNHFGDQKSKSTLVFLENSSQFNQLAGNTVANIEDDSPFWVFYPKGSSKVKTDINRDILWKLFEAFNLRPVTLVSFDDTWSAMRFKPIDKVKSKK